MSDTFETPITEQRMREVADRVQREILDLVADGTIPADVRTFGELHDHIDANELGGLCDDDDPNSDINTDDWYRIQELVEPWLQAGNTNGARLTLDGLSVRVWLVSTPDGPHLQLDPENCFLDGDAPGSYYLQPERAKAGV